MSLTSMLDERHGPLRRWFEERLPDLRAMQAQYRAAGTATLLPPGPVPYGTVGTAFDYRLRYYLAVTPPESFTGARGATKLSASRTADGGGTSATARAGGREISYLRLGVALCDLTDRLEPAGRRLLASDEAVLCRFCYGLALFEECFRAGPRPGSPIVDLGSDPSVDAILALAPAAAVDDLCALSWAFYDSQADLIARRADAILNPTFAGSSLVGGADADLVVSGCLLDVKTTKRPALRREVAYQLLGYPLLDFDDEHDIRAVGFYLARVPGIVTWSLEELLADAGGPDATPDRLRGELEELLVQRT